MQIKTNEEIDLIEVSIKVFKFLKKRMLLIIVFGFLSAAFGGYKSYKENNYFKTFFVAYSTNIPSDIIINVIETIQLNIEEGNIKELVADLSIKPEQAENLRDLKVELISGSQEGTLLKIKLEINNGENLNEVKNAIADYVRNHKFIKERINLFNSQRIELIKVLDNKISQLDRKHISQEEKPLQLSSHKEEIYLLTSNYTYRELVDLYERKQGIERQLQLSKEFEVIEDLAPLVKTSELVGDIIIAGFFGLIVGLGFSIFLEFRKLVSSRNAH
jgi:uncharacterized protein YaaR (DUF327 family)